MLSELLLLSAGLALALNRKVPLYITLALFLSYMAFILSFRPELDLKAIRDILIPIVFYFLGTRLRRIEDADRLVWLSTGLVLAVGFFEFLLLDIYTSFVDIFQYYVARGSLSADANFVTGSNLFISSTRIGGRNFFGFLGQIRASSVFLEPVTMGNFGAFLCLWALFRSGMRHRLLMFAAAFCAVVLADARFGMFVCIAFFPVAVVYKVLPRAAWWSVPFLIIFALALYGGWTGEVSWQDNLPGRVLHSAQIMMKLSPESILGIASEHPFVADNGFAYTFTQIGLVGLIGLWTLYIYAPVSSYKALQFKALTVTFICLNMIVSNSFYSIKLAALFWLAAGAADALSKDPEPSGRRSARHKSLPANHAISEAPYSPRARV
jgi:putative polymerase